MDRLIVDRLKTRKTRSSRKPLLIRGARQVGKTWTVVNGMIYPVDIKSGAAGKLRSLRLLLQTYASCPQGIVFSAAPYSELAQQKLRFLPLYYAYQFASSE